MAATLVVGGVAIAARVLWWATAGGTFGRTTDPVRFDSVLGAAAGLVAWGLLGWLTLSLALTTVASMAGSARLSGAARAITPAVVRHLVAVVVGVGLVTLPQLSARADDHVVSQPGHCTADRVITVDRPAPPGAMPAHDSLHRWAPDRPAAAPKITDGTTAALALGQPHAQRVVLDGVVVRRGDTLWAIVARHLGPGASDVDIAAEWPRWFHANRTTIGTDPDLIRPGQRLAVPPDASPSIPTEETP